MFYGSIYVNDNIYFVDPIRKDNQTFSMFNDPNDVGMAPKDYHKIQAEMRSLLKPALNAFMSKYKRTFLGNGKKKRRKRDNVAEGTKNYSAQYFCLEGLKAFVPKLSVLSWE